MSDLVGNPEDRFSHVAAQFITLTNLFLALIWTGFPMTGALFINFRMISDVQLAIFANALGVTLFLLVVLYHYVSVNNIKKE